jgi:hypothetical protein
MNSNKEFDELARRKLAECNFPYQEADWQAARALIDAGRSGRKLWPWALGTAVVLLSGSLWLGHSEAARTALPLAEARDAISIVSTGHAVDVPEGIATVTSAGSAATAPDRAVPEVAATPAAHTATPAARPSARPQLAPAGPASVQAAPATHRPQAPTKEGQRAEMPARITGTHLAEHRAANTEHGSTVDALHASTAHDRPVRAEVGSTAHEQAPSGVGEANDPPERPITPTSGGTVNTTLITRRDHTPQANDTGTPGTTATTQAGQDNTAQPAPAALDTMAAAPAPAAPSIVPEQAPWEIGILIGLSETRNRYSGGNSEVWANDLHGERSLSFGAEVMHMGKYIGLGAGLHYGSYTERLRAPAVDRISMSFLDHWYLLAVDTTILAITDTLPGTPPEYVGSPVQTTVNVLTQGTDTVIADQHLRDARDQVNRVSYLEVPLLVDLHLDQGRWRFGVRGGPTLGLLTGRRGSLPNGTENGYLVLAEQPFRELVLGYTARAYLRYRFNAAWSLGVEPGLRGLLFNSLEGGDLTQRPQAFGLMLGLAYRLR